MGNQTNVTTSALAGAIVAFTLLVLGPLIHGYWEGGIPDGLESAATTIVIVILGYVLPAKGGAPKGPPAAGAALLLLALGASAPAHAEDLARITIAQKHTTQDHEQFDPATGESLGFAQVTTGTAAAAYFAPMVTVSLVRVNLERRADYRAGVVPGVGYGFHWSPAWYDDTSDSPFLSVGVFLEGGLQLSADGADYAVFTVLPAVTILRWFSVGFGYEGRIALTDGVKDDGAAVLALGIASAF